MPVKVEIVCGSVDDCAQAQRNGATQIELCSAIEIGGLSPTLALVEACLETTSLPIWVMIRPRAGGFAYSAGEHDICMREARALRDLNIAGIVVGTLNDSGTVDARRTQMLAEAAEKPFHFHRAFEATPEMGAALDALLGIGCAGILTSGRRAVALDGAEAIAELVQRSEGRLEVMAGGGVRGSNVAELVARTGCHCVHLGPRQVIADPTAKAGEMDYGPLTKADPAEIAAVIAALG